MKWYNFRNGGKVLHLAAGGSVYTPTADAAPIVEQGGYETTNLGSVPEVHEVGALEALDYGATADYYNDVGFENQAETAVEQYAPVDTQYQGNIGTGSELYTPDQIASINQPQTYFDIEQSNQVLQDSGAQVPQLNQDIPPEVLQAVVQDAVAPEVVDHAGTAPVVDIDGGAESIIQLDNAVPPAEMVSHDMVSGSVPPNAQPVGTVQTPAGTVMQYTSPGQPGVMTGIPQGGHAANAISSYLSGANAQQYQDQIAGQLAAPSTWGSVDHGQLDQYIADQAAAGQAYVDAGNASAIEAADPSGTLTTEAGTEINYDTALEQSNAENIVDIINEGGINPETGDEWISAGPNTLSAGDEGFFGIGSDYNEEFQENYNAQSDHADANPTGQSTGTPIYDQGYADDDDFAASILNNSVVGTVGNAITGNNLVPTYDDLLPPEESFSDYDGGSDDDGGWFSGGGSDGEGDWGVVGDIGGAIADTVTSVADTVGSWFSGGSDDSGSSDSGSSDSGGGGGGYSCYVATALNDKGYWTMQKKLRLLSWCIKSKPEGKLDTKLWRNGYCWFGKEIIAPRVGHPLIRWLSDGFYEAVVEKRVTVKSMLGLAFFYIPSYKMGVWKMLRGKLEEIDRT